MHLTTLRLGLPEIIVATGYDIMQMCGRSPRHVRMQSIHSRQNQAQEGLVAQPAGTGNRCTIESGIRATWPGRDFIRAHRHQPLPGHPGPSREKTS